MDIPYGWLVDLLLTLVFGLLLYTIKSHITDDAEAHQRIRQELKEHTEQNDQHLDKRITRIENYLNGKLK